MTKLTSGASKKEQEVVNGLKRGDEQANKALNYLYKKHYRFIERHLRQKGAKKEDVKDVFQDTIIAFYENVRADKFVLQKNILSYLVTLSTRIWINKQKREGRVSSFENWADKEHDLVDAIIPDFNWEIKEKVQSIMNQLKEDCRKILELAIYHRLEMREIAKSMGFKNEQIARNKKSKCLGYLRKIAINSGFFKITPKSQSK